MSSTGSSKFEAALAKYDETAWLEALDSLLPSIHEVDRAAVQIWFRFFPLDLRTYLEEAEDRDETLHGLAMQGDYDLATQIDTSHRFLYGSRFWPRVKAAINERNGSFGGDGADLAAEIRAIAEAVGKADLATGIAAVGLMTFRQAGAEAFAATTGDKPALKGLLAKSPDEIVKERTAEPSQGILGFLRSIDKEFRVIWDETDKRARFSIIFDEEIATAAARDQSRNWLDKDKRCIEGVIPVECRSAACGTCWVGVIGGAENLRDVEPLERKQMKVFGYRQGDEKKPFMRLACQAAAEGSVSIVIPPWNGVFGKKVYANVEKVELEPATTSAAKLRETINDVLEN